MVKEICVPCTHCILWHTHNAGATTRYQAKWTPEQKKLSDKNGITQQGKGQFSKIRNYPKCTSGTYQESFKIHKATEQYKNKINRTERKIIIGDFIIPLPAIDRTNKQQNYQGCKITE